MKRIALVQSHCNTEEKITVLRNNISKITKLDLEILLFSHIPLPQDIVDSVKYFVYDKTNPVLWDERRQIYWWANESIKLESSVPDYGWTVFNQIIKSYNSILDEKYEMFFLMCYDLIIDEFVVDVIKKNKIGVFKHIKPKKVDEVGKYVDVIFETSLIFLSLNHPILLKLINNLSKSEYISNPDWIAEKYLEIILNRENIKIDNLGSVSDSIHESESIFDQSNNKTYEIFVDNQIPVRFRYIKKDNHVLHYFVVNEQMIEIKDEILVFEKKIEDVKVFGVFVDGVFDDLIHLLSLEKKINRITFLDQS